MKVKKSVDANLRLYEDITSLREAAKTGTELSPIFVPLQEAPKWFGVSRDTIYRQRRQGNIRIYKAGGRSVLKVSEVQKWIEASYGNET